MSTKYYLRPKGYEYLNVLNKTTENVLNQTKTSYINSVQFMINKSNSMTSLYKDLFNINFNEDKIMVKLEYPFETPEIYLCSTFSGSNTIFMNNKYYCSFNSLKEFYLKNKELLNIYDEYNKLIIWDDFESEILEKAKVSKKSHIEEIYNNLPFKYTEALQNGYVDKDYENIEWFDGDHML
jgi:hypothetical protein